MAIENVLKGSGGNNGAGIKRTIYFGLSDDVLTWPALEASPTTYDELTTHTAAIAMKTGKQMFSFYATIRKSSLESLAAGERGSKTSINRLIIVRSEVDASVFGFLEQHKNDEMVFIVEDLNGNLQVMGTEDLPAMIEDYSVNSGADVSDVKDLSITIESVGPLAKFYGTVAAPLAVPLTPAA